MSSESQDSKSDIENIYHDYHSFNEETNSHLLSNIISSQEDDNKVGKKNPSACAADSFPVKLHYVLNEIEKDGLANIVSWQPHGRCFVVHDRKEFVQTILPQWFRQSKYTSFQRQLNLYGFRRLTTGRDKGGYYHELFLRGKRSLCSFIQRATIKGTKVRKMSSPQTEPNFYQMKHLPLTNGEMHTNRCLQSSPNHHSLLANITKPRFQLTTDPISNSRQEQNLLSLWPLLNQNAISMLNYSSTICCRQGEEDNSADERNTQAVATRAADTYLSLPTSLLLGNANINMLFSYP